MKKKLVARRSAKKLSPRSARTTNQVCALDRDNLSYGAFWILVTESEVTIAEQASGEAARAVITMPKHVFSRFVDFYNGAGE